MAYWSFHNALAEKVEQPAAAMLLRHNGRAIAILVGKPFVPPVIDAPPVTLPEDFDPKRFLRSLIRGELEGDAGDRKCAESALAML